MPRDTTKASKRSKKGSSKLHHEAKKEKKKIKSRLNSNSEDINMEAKEFKWDNRLKIEGSILWLLYELIDKHIDEQYLEIRKIKLVHGGMLIGIMMEDMDYREMFWDWSAIHEQQMKMNEENRTKNKKYLESVLGVFKEDPENNMIGEKEKKK